MVRFTKETTRMGTDTGKQEKNTVMGTYTKEGTRTIRKKAWECIREQTAKDTKETTRMTKRMDKELWYTLMAHLTMVNGKMTENTEKES